jgi:hypothetical protein
VSIALLENEIRRLLSTKQAEVVCISGHWGVGKTFAWNKYLKEAHGRKDGIALGHYSYVSLFGITSLDALKHAIFESSVSSKHIGIEPSLDTLNTNLTAVLNQFGRKALSFLQYLPGAKIPAGAIGPLGYLSVKESIICIDDIERRGDKLAARDVLGLVSNLKEQKRCKVFLILNDDAMEDDKEHEDFKTHSEKVIDVYLKFAPTARESVGIALKADTEHMASLGRHCETLGIANIRVIKKLERAVVGVGPVLKDFDQRIMEQAIHSLVLMGWSHLEPTIAPSLEYLKRRNRHYVSDDDKESLSEQEAAWNALLDVYEFGQCDEFDLTLLGGIRDGYFDTDALRRLAGDADRQIREEKTVDSYKEAWALFYDSFGNNADELASKMTTSFIENAHRINLGDMNGTVELLKGLGKNDEANKIINSYMTQHTKSKAVFDRRTQMFGDQLTDPDLIKALDDKFKSFVDQRDPITVLLSMSQGWNPEDIALLRGMDVEAYYNMFKSAKGDTLRRIVNNCLQFSRISNVPDTEKEIATRARQALEKIGRESPINALRVRKYGIVVSAEKSSM